MLDKGLDPENIEKFSKFVVSIFDKFDWHGNPKTISETALAHMGVVSAPTGFTTLGSDPFVFVGIRSIAQDGIQEHYFLDFNAELYFLATRLWPNQVLEVRPNA